MKYDMNFILKNSVEYSSTVFSDSFERTQQICLKRHCYVYS